MWKQSLVAALLLSLPMLSKAHAATVGFADPDVTAPEFSVDVITPTIYFGDSILFNITITDDTDPSPTIDLIFSMGTAVDIVTPFTASTLSASIYQSVIDNTGGNLSLRFIAQDAFGNRVESGPYEVSVLTAIPLPPALALFAGGLGLIRLLRCRRTGVVE